MKNNMFVFKKKWFKKIIIKQKYNVSRETL